MKKLFVLLLLFLSSLVNAQDRVDSTPAQLSFKSQEITKALFWQKSSKTGKWNSTKNNARPYLGEGVYSHNFNSLFLGEYEGYKYLFCDTYDYLWRYPNLEEEWIVNRDLYAFLLINEDYKKLQNIQQGDVVEIFPSFYNMMFMGHPEYSFPFFLSLTETLRSCGPSDDKTWAIVAKRTMSQGKDVVRFLTPPHATPDAIDLWYYEISYQEFQKLFLPDKKLTYKFR